MLFAASLGLLATVTLSGCTQRRVSALEDRLESLWQRLSGRAGEDLSAPPRTYYPITPKQLPEPQDIDFPRHSPTRVVTILGDVPGTDYATWQNTGVSLREGDVLYIRAEGQVNYVNDLTMGPDGRGNTFPPSLLPHVSFMALVGRTHFALLSDGVDSSGSGLYGPGFVGSHFKMVYTGPGDYGLTGDNVLYLAINDSMDNDNALSLTVRIWVVRDGRVLSAV